MARFNTWLQAIRAHASREELLAELALLKEALHALPPDEAAATIIALLESGEDAETGLVLRVGEEGVLDEPTTYRVALLDLLGKTEPEAALDYSRKVLDMKSTPDEYAIALRNVAWLNYQHQIDSEIRDRFDAMLQEPEWLSRPTVGFLEAFDVAVELGGDQSLQSIARLVQPSASSDFLATHDSINHAAFIALDRMMLRDPDTIIDAMMTSPDFLGANPNFRASLMSRLDPSLPEQRLALDHYLLVMQHAPKELAYFASVFPNGNFIEGNRLVTGWETTLQSINIDERDRRILPVIQSMRSDATYAPVVQELDKIIGRLLEYQDPNAP